MNYWKFLLYTTIGAGCWHVVLALLGWYLHSIVPEDQLGNTIKQYNHYIVITIIAIVLVGVLYVIFKKKPSKN